LEALKDIQKKFKFHQLSLNDFRKDLNKVIKITSLINLFNLIIVQLEFVASKFKFSLELFGTIKDHKCWLVDSLILSYEECLSLAEMTQSTKGNLLYRATRDGFTAQAFHLRCDQKKNTITIIKNNLNYVFGAYASSEWNSHGDYINDPNAFLFSLKRNGVSFQDKFIIKNPNYALYGQTNCGPTFGSGHDLYICNQSNISHGCYSNLGNAYKTSGVLIVGNGNWLTT
jgi:hypothetical protein